MNRLQIIKGVITQISSFSYTKIELERNEQIATIWLNSPKDLNALSQEMLKNLTNAIIQLNRDTSIKVIVLRSKISKVFCAGADIKQFTSRDLNSYPESIDFRKVSIVFRQHHKPIIAIVQGKAFGGGFQIALLSDIILCSETAVFGLPQITLGLIPGLGGTQILPRIVGEKVAKRMIMTGIPIDAKEAHRLNVAHLLPTDNFEEKAKQIINAIANKSSSALIAASRAVKTAFQTSLDQGLEHQATIFQSIFNKKGAQEGVRAFVQKRKPNFKGI